MFKKGKALALTTGILFSATAISGIALSAVSCNSDDSKPALPENDAYNLYKDFVYQTHGRWAGNYANFIPNSEKARSQDVSSNTFGQFGLNKENLAAAGFENVDGIKLTNPFDASKQLTDSDPDGIGSHYAYEWLLNKISSFNLKDLGGTYSVSTKGNEKNYPSESITTDAVTLTDAKDPKSEKEIDVEKIKAGQDAALFDSAEGNKNIVAISTKPDATEVNFQHTGFITQGYLWNATDRITGKSVANQYGQNIIVTIKALNKEGQPKFAPVTSNSAKDVERNAFWITAHYDSTGTEGIESTSWGATDNGSGVGAALDLVKYYANPENAKELPCDLNIAFVGGEEVGVTGSTAMVEQYLAGKDDIVNKAQVGAMLNLDTAAGGDIIYVHSPWTELYGKVKGQVVITDKQAEGAATGTLVRDQLNAISKMQADAQQDPNAVLQLHPFLTPVPGADGYLTGQTGDWSDHAPFYKLGISNVAYIEATNFQIDGNTGYDGYSQVSNPVVWMYKKQQQVDSKDKKGNPIKVWRDVRENGKLVTKPGKPVEGKYDGEPTIDVWGPEEGSYNVPFEENGKTYRWARYNSGAIWHWNYDRPQFMEEHFGDRMERQLRNLGATLRTFIKTMNIQTFNASIANPTATPAQPADPVGEQK